MQGVTIEGCGRCRFWLDKACHRGPPAWQPQMARVGWPDVPEHFWCGEFKPVFGVELRHLVPPGQRAAQESATSAPKG